MGDTFRDIKNSTIINRSLINGAVDTLQQANKGDSAVALEKLTELVEQSGNPEAGEYLETFSEELQRQPEPRTSILRSMWDGIQKVLPAAKQTLEITQGIEQLFS
jgi:hypothetical protein